MRLFAFQGVRYGGEVEDPGALAGPPYDQINESFRDRLHQTTHHFAHLSCPVEGDGEGDGVSAYEHAARLHDAWLASRVLEEDATPRLYPYEIVLPDGGRRLGVTALAGLEGAESGVIRPHEQTVEKAVRDRLELLRAMQVDLEPILLLADDSGTLDGLLAEDTARGTPLVEHRDAEGCRHRLYAIDDSERIQRYVGGLRRSTGLIADGHHRYKVAGLHAAEMGAVPGSAASAKLAVVTSLTSPALTIDPIHRGLAEPAELAPLRGLAAEVVTEADRLPRLIEAVAEAEQPALGAWQDGSGEVWRFDPDDLESLLPGRRRLAVALLHELVLPALGLPPETATDGTIRYRSDPAELERQLGAGELRLAFVLPPMQPEWFAAAVADGGLLPPKSTRFLPKVASGLVWARHSTQLA